MFFVKSQHEMNNQSDLNSNNFKCKWKLCFRTKFYSSETEVRRIAHFLKIQKNLSNRQKSK